MTILLWVFLWALRRLPSSPRWGEDLWRLIAQKENNFNLSISSKIFPCKKQR